MKDLYILMFIKMFFQKFDTKAHAPRFSKAKDAGWWLVLGVVDDGELLALKRIGAVKTRSTVSLAFYTPEEIGHKIYTLYFMSDSYIGLDQQFDICLDVVEASIESQVNTEVKFDDAR
jgi:activating signal cointegrator complex subunit 3